MNHAIVAASPQDDYQAQDDMRTLTRAEEIKADKKRHGKALSHGKQQMSAIQAVVKPDADDVPGVKEHGEGSKAEEAKDAKEMAGKPMKMPMGRIAPRPSKVNKASVI